MSFFGTLFSSASTAVSGFSIGTWIKMGAVVALAAAMGGLYWYGEHEAGRVSDLTKQNGAQAQIIADDKANISALQTANQNWAKAFAKYQKDMKDQVAAYKNALALKEKVNAKLAEIEKLLRTNPRGAADAINRLNDALVCLLDRAAGGHRDGCAVAPAGKAGAPATGHA